jgi:hypothetical protein
VLRRTQLPIRVAFAMTVNKAQGLTLMKVGLYLKDDVFSHGQLYVALFRWWWRPGENLTSSWALTLLPDIRRSGRKVWIFFFRVYLRRELWYIDKEVPIDTKADKISR